MFWDKYRWNIGCYEFDWKLEENKIVYFDRISVGHTWKKFGKLVVLC
jgi:hypothetical protein